MIDYIPTPEPVREERSTLPEGRALTLSQAEALRALHPGAALMQVGDVVYLTAWTLPTPQPTDAELEAALPAAQARAQQQQDLNEADRELRQLQDNHSRALALGRTQEANEIMETAQEWLAYVGEVRGNAPS